MNYRNLDYDFLIFDLDGTLIDSCDSILICIAETLRAISRRPQVKIEASLVGPPLLNVFSKLLSVEDHSIIEVAVDKFKDLYDSIYFDYCKPFPNAAEYFSGPQIKRNYLVTNKRRIPTDKILRKFGWATYFDKIYTSDLYTTDMPDKRAVISKILESSQLRKDRCVYIGDTVEDQKAALLAGISFLNPLSVPLGSARAQDALDLPS